MAPLLVAFWTGARPNELAALRWGDVSASSFRIRAGRSPRGVESTPKTAASVRDIDLLPPVVEALRAQKAQQAAARLKAGLGAPGPGLDYVFTGYHGGPVSPNRLRAKVWYPTLAKAGLQRRIAYQTRHSFASNALAAGEAALVGGGAARPHHARDALQHVRALHPEPDAA